jgi:2,3-bisphosphoglycerate-dependent phosphoglycerate mutase
VELNILTGVPLMYELDVDLTPITHYSLGDPDEIHKAGGQSQHKSRHKRVARFCHRISNSGG